MNNPGFPAGAGGAAAGFLAWIGRHTPVLPFVVFCLVFFLLPAGYILAGAFFSPDGSFTLANFASLGAENIRASFMVSIRLSAVSSALAAAAGLPLAYALSRGGLPRWLTGGFMSIVGVASNFAGVPLAFAFISTLGRMGLVTWLFKEFLGLDLYAAGFSLYGFWGLCVTYMFFQLPLMVIVITPAIEALRPEWREAAQSLGAGRLRYWLRVALPILAPSVVSAALLLFGNAFGAYATAYALTGGVLNLVTILIGAQIRGDVFHNPNLGYAMASGMIAVMALTTAAGALLRRRAARWLP